MNEATLNINNEVTSKPNPWVIWSVAALFAFYQFMLQSSASILANGLSREFHLSSFSIGLFSASYIVAYMICQIPCGMLVDKYGPRKLLLISVPLAGLSCLLLAYAPNPTVAFIARASMGVASAPAVISTIYLASSWFPPSLYAVVVGITELVCLSGGGLGQKMLSEVTERSGWRSSMYISAVAALFIMALIWRYVYDAKNDAIEDSGVSTASLWNRFAVILSSKDVVLTGLFTGISGVLLAAFSSLWGIPYLQTTYSLSLADAATGTALVFVGTGISSVLLGYLSDKCGQRKPVMGISTAIAVILLTITLYVKLSLTAMFSLLFLVGLSSGGYMLGFAVAKELLPRHCHGTGIGFINMMSLAIGGPILQPVIGALLQMQGAGHLQHLTAHDYEVALGIVPLTIVISLFILPFIRETYCKSVALSALQKGRTRSPAKSHNSFWRLRRSAKQQSATE